MKKKKGKRPQAFSYIKATVNNSFLFQQKATEHILKGQKLERVAEGLDFSVKHFFTCSRSSRNGRKKRSNATMWSNKDMTCDLASSLQGTCTCGYNSAESYLAEMH